jgi:putative membrane protein
MNDTPRKPRAFIIEPEATTKHKASPKIEFTAPEPAAELVSLPEMPRPSPRSGRPWGSILIGALAALVTLWAGVSITRLIEGFFESSPLLGWVATGIAGLAGFAALALVFREVWGLLRLRRIEALQHQAVAALNTGEEKTVTATLSSLRTLYARRPDLSWNLKQLAGHDIDIISPLDRLRLAERLLLEPLDEQTHRIIAKRAKRVTLLTTVTPIAALDVAFVAAQNIAMLRELATLYGGRPSTLATLRLSRLVLMHLAVAGGLALSDNFFHLFVGKGVIGKLSARFGEGAVNGILTSRIGLAAVDVCRPIPKPVAKRESLASLMREIVSFSEQPKSEI